MIRRCFSSGCNRPLNVLFFGSDQFSIRCLDAIKAEKDKESGVVKHIEVVCPPDSLNGRKGLQQVPLKTHSQDLGLVVHSPPNRKTLTGWQLPSCSGNDGGFDIGVVVSFGYFLPRRIITQFPLGCINAHPSLLPKYQGAAPIHHTILNGDKESGVCIIEVHPDKFDVGKILKKEKMMVDEDITCAGLTQQLANIAAKLLVNVLSDLDGCRSNSEDQDQSASIKAPKIQKEMGLIQWQSMDSIQIYQLWRALSSSVGVYCFYNNKRVQLLTLHRSNVQIEQRLKQDALIGSSQYDPETKALWIRCKQGWIGCSSLKMEGGKAVSALDAVNGFGQMQFN